MRRKLALIIAATALALPGVAIAAPGGGGGGGGPSGGDTGAACPEEAPDRDGDGAPDCGNAGEKDDKDKGGNGGGGGTPPACPPTSGNPGGSQNCGNQDKDDDGIDNDDDNCPDVANPGQEDTDNDGTGDACETPPPSNTCNDRMDNDSDGKIDGADTNDCQNGDTDENTGTPPPPPAATDRCTADAGDEGLNGDTIAQQLSDGGLEVDPLLVDPEADGAISSEVIAAGEGTDLEPVTNEVACLVSLPGADL